MPCSTCSTAADLSLKRTHRDQGQVTGDVNTVKDLWAFFGCLSIPTPQHSKPDTAAPRGRRHGAGRGLRAESFFCDRHGSKILLYTTIYFTLLWSTRKQDTAVPRITVSGRLRKGRDCTPYGAGATQRTHSSVLTPAYSLQRTHSSVLTPRTTKRVHAWARS